MHLSSRKLPFFIIICCLTLLWMLWSGASTDRRVPPLVSASPTPNVHPTDNITVFENPTPSVLGEKAASASAFVPVVKVVDGDTISVIIEGKKETLRLIGINTPETVDPRKGVECFGKEASRFASSLMQGKQVRLEADPTQQDRDRYARLLRYVYLVDGRMVNELMVQEGYAYEYTYANPYRYQTQFRQDEQDAKSKLKGLWSQFTCNGVK